MDLELSWLEQTAHNRSVDGSNPSWSIKSLIYERVFVIIDK